MDTNTSPKSEAGLLGSPLPVQCPFCGLLPSLGPQVPGSPTSLPLGASDPASPCAPLRQGSAKGKKDVAPPLPLHFRRQVASFCSAHSCASFPLYCGDMILGGLCLLNSFGSGLRFGGLLHSRWPWQGMILPLSRAGPFASSSLIRWAFPKLGVPQLWHKPTVGPGTTKSPPPAWPCGTWCGGMRSSRCPPCHEQRSPRPLTRVFSVFLWERGLAYKEGNISDLQSSLQFW